MMPPLAFKLKPNPTTKKVSEDVAITSVVFNDNGTVTITKGGSATTYTNLDNSLKSKVETTVNSGESITDLFDHVFSTNSLTAV